MDEQVKIIITGGQCSGKSSLIRELSKEFECVKEAALSVFNEAGNIRINKNNFMDFNRRVSMKQIELESKVKNEIVFLDRSLIDNILYYKENKANTPRGLIEDIKKAKYTVAFFLDTLPEKYWDLTESKKPRATDYKEGVLRAKKLFNIYKESKIPVISVPVMSVEERVEFIKNELKENGIL